MQLVKMVRIDSRLSERGGGGDVSDVLDYEVTWVLPLPPYVATLHNREWMPFRNIAIRKSY